MEDNETDIPQVGTTRRRVEGIFIEIKGGNGKGFGLKQHTLFFNRNYSGIWFNEIIRKNRKTVVHGSFGSLSTVIVIIFLTDF